MSAFMTAMQTAIMDNCGESGECLELGVILDCIRLDPDLVFDSANADSDEARWFIEETGGAVWWCHTCDCLTSPNRSCDCHQLRPSVRAFLDECGIGGW